LLFFGFSGVFGEMVDILCSTGCPAAAIRLEELWNDLAAVQQRLGRQFSLLCGYALGQFGREEHTRVFRDVCAAHARVVPAESYKALREDRDNQERLIAGLQQQALALQAEVARRHAVEARLLQAKEAAEAANRAKSRFLAIISHELRTPLTAIVGYAELMLAPVGEGLAKGETSAGERQETLEVILRNGRELVRLLNDVLDLSKMEAGLLQVERVPFKPADLVADVMDVLCLQAAEKRLRVRVDIGRDVPERVLGDPTRLRQILLNVVGNALKFTPAGGTVDVELRMLGHATLSPSPSTSPPSSSPPAAAAASLLECTVRDTGCGMTPEHAQHLFQPFSQGPDSSMSRHHGGTGLGLFLSRQLARLLGGNLVLAHTAPGHGATFVATVRAEPDPALPDGHPHQAQSPVVTEIPPPQPLRELSAEGIDRASISVLVVDDNAVNRRLVQRVLERLGYVDVDTAADGLQALNHVAERHSDLVLMDLQMPMMDGHSACQAIRKIYEDQQRAQQPVIIGTSPCLNVRRSRLFAHGAPPSAALTAQALSDERDRCVASGMDDFVSKPFDFKVLTHKLAHWTSIIVERRRSN
jgi:signal transduction histidine kinase/DNA-binding response OmpR family regulator